jgi:ribosomal protein L19
MSKSSILLRKIIALNHSNSNFFSSKNIKPGEILKLKYFETPQFKFLLEKKKNKSNRYFYYHFLKRTHLKNKIGICISRRNRYSDGFLILRLTVDNNPVEYSFNFRSKHIVYFLKATQHYVNFNKSKKAQMYWLRNRKSKKSRIHVID